MNDQNNHYTPRINLVQDYITHHLKEEIKLEILAGVAGFSPFHFHRIFKDMVGETVNNFITRQKLERALSLMKHRHRLTLTEIAIDSGFRSSSDFSRTFRRYFGISPKQWDGEAHLEYSKIRQVDTGLQHYTLGELKMMEAANRFKVRVEAFPETQLVYIRVRNSYANPDGFLQAFKTLADWSEGNAIQSTFIGMSQDDPDVTPASQCRYDVCMSVPLGTKTNRKEYSMLNTRLMPSCKIACLSVMGDMQQVDTAWQYLMRYWLPHSGSFPENLPAMEIYRQSPVQAGWEAFDMECVVPIIS